jgi:hypothetical protein
MNTSDHGFARITPISLDTLASQVPAAFSDHAAQRTSANYVFISTKQLVTALLEAGFVATHARQARVRRAEGGAFARHMLCFQPQREVVSLVDAIPQIVLINSHDGCCSYQLRAGLYRPLCTNGLLTRLGDCRPDPRSPPWRRGRQRGRGRAGHHARLLADRRGGRADAPYAAVVRRAHAFATQALAIRYPADQHQPFAAEALLTCRRAADDEPDLWHVFNVCQENLVRGGISGRSANGRSTCSRGIQAIRQDVRINNDLWQLAMSLIRQ